MRRTLLTTASAAAAIALAATPALANAPYLVSVGGVTDGSDVGFAATGEDLYWATPLYQMSCASHFMQGTAHSGSQASHITTIDAGTWDGCVGFLGIELPWEHIGDWALELVGPASSGNADVIDIELTNMTAVVSQTGAPGNCTFTVEGSASGTFDESTQTISVNETGFTGDLLVTDMNGTGCYTLIQLHDPMNLVIDYTLTSDPVLIS